MGKVPTDQEVKDRAREIQEAFRNTAVRYADPSLGGSKQRVTVIQKQIKRLELAKAAELRFRDRVQESEKRIGTAQRSIEKYQVEMEDIRAQIRDLREKQKDLRWGSQEYVEIERQARERRANWRALRNQKAKTESDAQAARKTRKTSNTQLKHLSTEIKRLEGEIQELSKRLARPEGKFF